MKRAGPEGSVSIFLACVILTLIVFCCTIVDVTRIHVARLQAERAVQLASESILASYDSQLQSQYGIFAKDFSSEQTILNDLNRYTQSELNPTTISTTSNVFYNSSDSGDEGFSLYANQLGPISLSNQHTLLDPSEVKGQILAYMTYRAPFSLVQPFIEKMGLLKKASKTSEILKQKNEVVTEIQTLELGYHELEMLIDGIMIDSVYGGISLNAEGFPALSNNYVKKLYTTDLYKPNLYASSEIPLKSLEIRLNENICIIDGVLKNYRDAIAQSEQAFSQLITAYQSVKEIEDQLESNALNQNVIQQEIDALESTKPTEEMLLTIAELEEKLSQLEQEALVLSQQQVDDLQDYKELVTVFNALDNLMVYDYLPQIQQINQAYDSELYQFGLKGIHEEVLLQIDRIKAKTPEVANHISTFKETLIHDEDLYVDGTTDSIQEELVGYEKLLGFNEEGGGDLINNLSTMQTTVEANLAIINSIDKQVQTIATSRNALHTYWYNQQKTKLTGNAFNEIVHDLQLSYDENLSPSPTIVQDLSSSLVDIETALDGYSRDLFFDYSGMDTVLEKTFDYKAFVKKFEGMFPEITLPQLDLKVINEDLPSAQMGIADKEAYEVSDKPDLEANSKYLDTFKKLGDSITEVLVNLKDDLYVNEYILGMFKGATDNLLDKEGKPVDALTLSHFPKSTHYLNYEVEYVLFGHSADVTNLLESVAILMGIRIVLNLIALLLDFDRMETIINISNAVAGWWSLGIGSIIVTSVLTLIWATVESVSDIGKLLNGEKVPIIKNSDTWETDLFSGLSHIVKETTEVDTKKSYLPSLSYKDYLRLFLLSGQVEDSTKCMRILDLIQMNLSKERNEAILIGDYVVGFDANASVDVNTLFFELPFMPDSARKHSAFHFDFKVEAGY